MQQDDCSVLLLGPLASREERRWLEKQNKAERLQLKREEMVRIRTLVGECLSTQPSCGEDSSLTRVCVCADNAYACDPRVRKFKLEEKQQKAAQRQAREEAVRRREEEKERVGAECCGAGGLSVV